MRVVAGTVAAGDPLPPPLPSSASRHRRFLPPFPAATAPSLHGRAPAWIPPPLPFTSTSGRRWGSPSCHRRPSKHPQMPPPQARVGAGGSRLQDAAATPNAADAPPNADAASPRETEMGIGWIGSESTLGITNNNHISFS
jgi:hypothetical protein